MPFYSQVKRQKDKLLQSPTHHSQAPETLKQGSSSDSASLRTSPSQFPSDIIEVC